MTTPSRMVFTYTGTTPGADASTYVLFDSSLFPPGVNMKTICGKRAIVSIECAGAGTLNAYHKRSAGTTWYNSSTQAVPARVDGTANVYTFMVSPYEDVRLSWVNGGVAQTTWVIEIEISPDQAPLV